VTKENTRRPKRYFADALKVQRRLLGKDHLETLSSWEGLNRVQLRERKYVDSESTLCDALKEHEEVVSNRVSRFQLNTQQAIALPNPRRLPSNAVIETPPARTSPTPLDTRQPGTSDKILT
jgi:hypothetical protein